MTWSAPTQGISIGGDWYDAFLQPDGDTVLVIGDVMGHDIEAAGAMGRGRHWCAASPSTGRRRRQAC